MIGEIISKPGAITITDKKGSRLQDNPVDLRHLIRSVQRLEGNPDCFQTAKEHCDQKGCVWRVYCLEEAQKHPVKGGQRYGNETRADSGKKIF